MYFEKGDLEKCYKRIIKDIIRNYSRHIKNYNQLVKNLLQSSLQVKKSAEESNARRYKAFKGWLKAMEDYWIPIIAPFAVEEILDPVCRKLLTQEFSDKSAEFFAVISSPAKLNTYQKMRLEIVNSAISGKNIEKSVVKLSREYFWYGEYSYIEPFFDKEHFKKEIKKLTKKEATKEKKKIITDLKKSRKDYLTLLQKIKNPKLKLIAKVLNDYTFIRTERIEYFKKAQANVRVLFNTLADELTLKNKKQWTLKDTANFTNGEILRYFKKGRIPDKKEIDKRKSHHYLYYFDKKSILNYDASFIAKSFQIIVAEQGKKAEIKGLTAHSGLIKGKARLVYNKCDLGKVKNGDILIARTTMPDYLPAMKKAAAFVTAEGGITSHAAIVSRELKKPCIVGTKNCMEAVKDGDLVEVDANKGIVKILKRA